MSLPTVISPTVKTPGFALRVDLLAGAASPGSDVKKACLIAVKAAGGTITADTQLVEAVAGEATVGTYLGAGTPGHLASKRLFEEYGLAQLDVCSPAAPAGVTATGTITFAAGPVTVQWTVYCWIAGRKITTYWGVGEGVATAEARLIAAINALGSEMPVIASSGGAGIVTLTFRVVGLIGNDCCYRVQMVGGAGGTCTATAAKLTGGTLEPTCANVLTLIEGKEYDLYCLCVSNAEAQSCIVTTDPGRLKASINTRAEGFQAKLQQAVIGVTDALATAKTGAGNLDHTRSQLVFCLNGESLPSEFAGAEVGARLKAEGLDPAANRIEQEYLATLYGCASPALDYPTAVEVEDALNTGLTIITYSPSGALRPSRPITSYHKDSSGNADYRCFDTSQVTGSDAIAKDLRVNVPREFKGAKLSPDIAPGAQEPPKGVVQVKDVYAFVAGRMRYWVNQGVADATKWAAAVANGTFAVEVDPTDDAQCNIVLPEDVVAPLAKFSCIVQKRAS